LPCAVGPQVPLAVAEAFLAALHASQEPLQVVSQQKPSWQNPPLAAGGEFEAHSRQPVTLQSWPAASLQVEPLVFCDWQAPFLSQ
jgi:hypothetical protein